MKSRRRARSAALKVLYELDTTNHLPGVVLAHRLTEEALTPDVETFTRQLVTGVLEHRQHLDQLIQHYAPEWPIEQMAVIDRNLLRIAIYEFDVASLTPMKVAINEAIEIAKIYGADSTPRFINGVLGSLVAPDESAKQK